MGAVFVKQLGDELITQVLALEAKSNLSKNIFYKIDLNSFTDSMINHVLYYEHGEMKAYMTVDCSNGFEIECAAIADDENKFLSMYNALLNEAKALKATKILFIIDKNDKLLSKFVRSMNLCHSFTEYRMNLDGNKFSAAYTSQLVLRDAVPSDIKDIMSIDGEWLNVETEISNVKVALLNGKIIGKIAIYQNNGVYGLYSFVVDAPMRGKGYGREILSQVIQNILQNEHKKIYLEVNSQNTSALKLYESTGFYLHTAFDYYEYVLK